MFRFLGLISFFIVLSTHARAFEVTATSMSVKPGEVFIVTVIDVSDSLVLQGTLEGYTLHFMRKGDNRFIAFGALPVETQPGNYPLYIDAGSEKRVLYIKVRKGGFKEIHLMLPESKVDLSEQDLRRAREEESRLQTIWHQTSSPLWEGSFILPLDNPLSTPFGTKRIMNNKRESTHRGLDIRGKAGEPVRAANNGSVVLAENLFFGGNTVVLDHGMGFYTLYMHLLTFKVGDGEIVRKGDIIGLVGSTGRASGPHLHFGANLGGISVDPLSVMKLKL